MSSAGIVDRSFSRPRFVLDPQTAAAGHQYITSSRYTLLPPLQNDTLEAGRRKTAHLILELEDLLERIVNLRGGV